MVLNIQPLASDVWSNFPADRKFAFVPEMRSRLQSRRPLARSNNNYTIRATSVTIDLPIAERFPASSTNGVRLPGLLLLVMLLILVVVVLVIIGSR